MTTRQPDSKSPGDGKHLSAIDDWRRSLPAVATVMAHPLAVEAAHTYGKGTIAALIRERLQSLRVQSSLSADGRIEALAAMAASEAQRRFAITPGPVINATGVLMHPSLGRAPLSDAALEAVLRVGQGYSALDYDLEQGSRGSRNALLAPLLGQLTGADDGVVVNNNAAALQLAIAALARGGEVVISREQSLEYAGSYRVAELLTQSGVTVTEIGTSNKTRLSDYAEAISPQTALLVHIQPEHPRGGHFSESVPLPDLVMLGKQQGLPVIDIMGSGCLINPAPYGVAAEPLVQDSIAAGVDVVCFSGDRFLGGPQCGIVVGGADFVARIRRHVLMRVLRVDKITLAALHATLIHYLRDEALDVVPVWRMLALTADTVKERAEGWRTTLGTLPHIRLSVGQVLASLDGGTAAGQTLPSSALLVRPANTSRGWAASLAGTLRRRQVPLLGRIEDSALALDARTVLPHQDREVVAALRQTLADS